MFASHTLTHTVEHTVARSGRGTRTHVYMSVRTRTQRYVCIRHVRVHVDVLLLSPLGPLLQRCHIARTNFNFNSQTSFTCMKCEYESPSEISLCTWPCHAVPCQTRPGPVRPDPTRPGGTCIHLYVCTFICLYVHMYVCTTQQLLLRLQIINDN